MCAIAGLVRWEGPPPSVADVRAMCDVMVHRGPDDAGYYADAGAAIGMRRLSIIDLETGRQPIANEDGSVQVVLNGEIYNYRELRRDLEARGHRFRTSSDTETIAHLYEEHGDAAVEHLRGMFALAVWDARARRLLLARDRLGIKPLYVARMSGGLAFASELKALFELPGVSRALDWGALGHLLAFLTTPSDRSIVAGVGKLEPAHRLTVDRRGEVREARYWQVEFAPDTGRSPDDLAEELRTRLDEAVDLHLRSDVPVGLFLSGGLDSTAVLAAMTAHTAGPVRTFSIGFEDRAYDERRWARQAADAYGAEHHELIVTPQALDLVEDLAWHLDEPFGDSSAIPTYLVARLAAEHVKVVLSGDGGDEIFGGYDRYVVERRERAYDRVPLAARRALGAIGRSLPEGVTGRNFLRHLAYDGAARYLDAATIFGAEERRRLLHPDVHARVAADDPWARPIAILTGGTAAWLSALQHWDLHAYLPLDILTKVDRMTMAHSIEARPVLVDHQLVEFAARVPADLVLRDETTKYLFKRAMRGRVPDAIIDRSKQGFAVPLARWFRGDWGGLVRDVLLSRACRERGIFDPARIRQLVRLHEGGRNLDLALWTLVSFELWCRRFLDRPAARPAAAAVPAVAG